MTKRSLHTLIITLGLFAFWIVLSGKFDALHLGMGVVCAIGVSLLSADLLYSEGKNGEKRWLSFLPWGRILLYIPWLAWEIIKSNIQVMKLVLGPMDRLDPEMLTVQPDLQSEVSQVVFGNSITLTPGTVTLDIEDDGTYVVHAVDQASAEGLRSGEMARRVAWAFDGAEKK